MAKGYIYLITNDFNDKKYVGQTSRDIDIRFNEHCFDKKATCGVDREIQKVGYQHFKVEEIEEVELDQLDEREKYWIKYYDTYNSGYNLTVDGVGILKPKNIKAVRVTEKELCFPSAEYLSRILAENTGWSQHFMATKIRESISKNKEFLGYHFEHYMASDDENYSTDDEIADWCKTLNIRFQGKRIRCNELEEDFDSVGELSNYLIENGYYKGKSNEFAVQTVYTILNKNLKRNLEEPIEVLNNFTFCYLPGTVKNKGGDFHATKIYCPQLDMTFETEISAARYFTENKLFGNVKLKTAKLRISDVIRGFFKDYKGYSFEKVEEISNIEYMKQVERIKPVEEKIILPSGRTKPRFAHRNRGPTSEAQKIKLSQACPTKKPVICITTNKTFDSVRDASKYYGLKASNISDVCKGRRHSCGTDPETGQKLVWEFLKV